MTHEPECPYSGAYIASLGDFGPPWTEYCRNCDIARAAYQRGREDAAKAVMGHLLEEPTGHEWDLGFNVAIYEAAAAARGESEEE